MTARRYLPGRRPQRYVTSRVGRNGKIRWYWQRRGFPLTRLPDNLIDRIATIERLNSNADALVILRPSHEPERGTVAWVIARYRTDDEYCKLATGTAKYYDRILQRIEALGPRLPFAQAWTRRAVVDFIERQEHAGAQRQYASVLKNLFNVASYHGLVEVDHTRNLRLKTTKSRERIWSDEEIARWVVTAEREDESLVTAFRILEHTAQRPGDVLRMTWADYKPGQPGHIRVRQEKTKVLLDVPVHSDLAVCLDALPRSPNRIVTNARGRPVSYRRFLDRFTHISKVAGIDGAQPRDLRRTAMVNMAIAGATEAMIASVSGHSIEATRRILETYLPRNTKLADAAIARLPTAADRVKRGTKV